MGNVVERSLVGDKVNGTVRECRNFDLIFLYMTDLQLIFGKLLYKGFHKHVKWFISFLDNMNTC